MLKELFNLKPVTSNIFQDEENNSSSEIAIQYSENKKKYIPDIDFTNPFNFCKFGLAEEYYKNSFKYVYEHYPYDGSKTEELKWYNNSIYLDQYIFDKVYPKTVGSISYVNISPYLNWDSEIRCSNFPYIPIYGGLNKNKIIDLDSDRNSNLKIDLEKGFTIQYDFILNDEFNEPTSSVGDTYESFCHFGFNTPSEYIEEFNNLMFDLRGNGHYESFTFNLKYFTGSTLYSHSIQFITPGSNLIDDMYYYYHNLSIAIKYNTSSFNFESDFYYDGLLIYSTHSYYSGANTTQYLTGVIGCLPLVTSSYGYGIYEPIWGAYGNFPAVNISFDNFRLWGEKLSGEQIYKNYNNKVYGNFNEIDEEFNELLLNYKFNEGITNNTFYDKNVLDFSGRKSNTIIENYISSVRSTQSATDFNGGYEIPDPILNIYNSELSSSILQYTMKGKNYDRNNNHSLLNHFPEWIVEEDYNSNRELIKLTQILSTQLDEIYLLGKNLSNIKNLNYTSGSFNEDIIANILGNYGLNCNELFSDLSFDEYFLDKTDNVTFLNKIQNIKINLYKSLYNNLINIYKTKGTEQSIRNLFRSLGFDENFYKIKYYSNNDIYEINGDKRNLVSERKNYLDLTGNRSEENILATAVMHYDTYSSNTGTYFVSGSKNTTNPFELGNSFSFETTVIFPKTKNHLEDGYVYFPESSLTGSLFGFYCPILSPNNTTIEYENPYCNVFFQRKARESKEAKFIVKTSMPGSVNYFESDYYNVFDETKWTFALRLVPKDYIFEVNDTITTGEYNAELYGIQENAGIIENEFLISGSFGSGSSQHTESYIVSNFNSGSVINNSIDSLLLSGSSLYIGGDFTTVSGSTRNRIAAVDKDSGALLPFNPNAGGVILSLLLSGSNLYLGGTFTTVSGSTRNRLAAVDKDSGALLPFNPDCGSSVFSLLLSGSNLYLGGFFTTVSGSPRNRLACVNKDSGALLPFNPNCGASVNTLLLSGSNLYLGGSFTTVSGSTRNRIAAVDKDSGALLPFNPNCDNVIEALLLSGSNLYLGGQFTTVSGSTRNRLACVDKHSGVLLPFNPNCGISINELALSGSILYIGGSFTTISGSARYRLAAVDKDSGALLPFNQGSTSGGSVDVMLLSGSSLYVGGTFTNVSGSLRDKVAKIDYEYNTTNMYNISYPKRPYIGSLRTNFTGSLLYPTQAKFSYYRGWFTNLSNEEVKNHSFDPFNFGLLKPYENISHNGNNSLYYIPRIKSLLFNYDFEGITENVGYFKNFNSGTIETQYDNFIFSKNSNLYLYDYGNLENYIDKNYVLSSKNRTIDNLLSNDMINILSEEDRYFGKTINPISHILSVEKNIYDVVNQEILNYFSNISNFNELIGEPVNYYRSSYKQLDKLKKIFFDKVYGTVNIDQFMSYYKWLDTTLNYIIYELIPISMRDEFKIGIFIESHILERNKRQHTTVILKSKNNDFTFDLTGFLHPSLSWLPAKMGQKLDLQSWNPNVYPIPNKVIKI